MKVGVFDSGIGGLSVANAIEAALPELQVIFKRDTQNFPYGERAPDEILSLITPIIDDLVTMGCKVIVVACNTVSTTQINTLREQFAVSFVAIEPMVKPAAALSKSKIIAICATPATLRSERYAWLKNEYAQDITVLEPGCSGWAQMIEDDTVDEAAIARCINQVIKQGADVIALSCTHYHWIEPEILRLANGQATVIQPESAIVAQLTRVLAQLR